MKTRNLIALAAFLGLSSTSQVGAAQKDEAVDVLTGYQEILTDPSYSRQIITLTYPHIGNTGTNPEDEEANRIHASGLVIRDLKQIGRLEVIRSTVQAAQIGRVDV